MNPLSPNGEPEAAAEVQAVALELGTPVRFLKLDAKTGLPVLMGPDIAGGFVHAAVGTKGYVFDPKCEVHVADDLPGNVQYTAKTSVIKSVALRDGAYFLTTMSGSVYQVLLTGGDPIIAPGGKPREVTPDASDKSVVGKTTEVVGSSRWTFKDILRRLGGG
ncbi:MAG TPA: hypothetical protein PKV72_05535 [Candidatus Peribacteria bacterium]|nr:hypothetical protein [Candidatus Peribacteria bacterium]